MTRSTSVQEAVTKFCYNKHITQIILATDTSSGLSEIPLKDRAFRKLVEHPILDREKERGLTCQYHKTQEESKRFAVIPADLQQKLHEQAKFLLDHNWRFICKAARKYFRLLKRLGLNKLDLMGAGARGFLKALERYDPAHNTRILTYAGSFIKGEILRELKQARLRTHSIKVSRQRQLISNIEAQLRKSMGHTPRNEDIANAAGIAPGHYELFLQDLGIASTQPISLDQPMGNDQSNTLADIIAVEIDSSRVDPSDLDQAIRTLGDENQIEVIRMHYGLGSAKYNIPRDKALTMEEIGVKLGLSPERIRQIEARALDKLSQAKNLQRYSYFWISNEANILELDKMFRHLFTEKQSTATEYKDWALKLLSKLSQQRVEIKDKFVKVLQGNEQVLLEYRLGLKTDAEVSFQDLLKPLNQTDIFKLTSMESRAIHKIQAFFRSLKSSEINKLLEGQNINRAEAYDYVKVREALNELLAVL